MKKLGFFIISICMIFLFSCSEDSMLTPGQDNLVESSKKSAKKPLPVLVGETTEYLVNDYPEFLFAGSIDFSSNEGYETYIIGYEVHDLPSRDNSSAQPLMETFYIYDGDVDPDNLVLKGTNSGVIIKNEKFITNGIVSEAHGELFKDWIGCNVHVRGTIEPDDEKIIIVKSTFRLN